MGLKQYRQMLNDLGIALPEYDFSQKDRCRDTYVMQMWNRTRRMFRWTGLPETIREKNLESLLQFCGKATIIRHNGNLYALYGNDSGIPDQNWEPTQMIVSNAYLSISKTYDIGKNCVRGLNDSSAMGLLPLHSRYASHLVENDLSMQMNDIITRVQAVCAASDDSTAKSFEKFIADLKDGKYSAVTDESLIKNLAMLPWSNAAASQQILSYIQYHQYMKASWYNDLGIQANYDMKRESINSNEAQLSEDALIPLVDDMLECRKEICEQVNELFGVNWSVDKSSVWKENSDTREAELENLKNNGEGGDDDGSEETGSSDEGLDNRGDIQGTSEL